MGVKLAASETVLPTYQVSPRSADESWSTIGCTSVVTWRQRRSCALRTCLTVHSTSTAFYLFRNHGTSACWCPLLVGDMSP